MRNKYYQIRLTESEHTRLSVNAESAKMSRSAYIRHAILNVETIIAIDTLNKGLKELKHELSKQGTNLNQIAYKLNAYGVNDETLNGVKQAIKIIAEEAKIISQVLAELRKD